MGRTKGNIQRIYKKSILPSILLFLTFLVACGVVFVMFEIMYESYLMESKTSELYDKADHIGWMLTSHMKGNSVFDAAASLEEYLGEDSDICITDNDNRILQQFGDSIPDFDLAEETGNLGESVIFPDLDAENPWKDQTLDIEYRELLKRSITAIRETENKAEWAEEKIVDGGFWVEVPIEVDDYRIYYKDEVILTAKDTFYIIGIVAVSAIMMAIPTFLLFINVMSSIITQGRMVNLLYLDPITGGRNWLFFIQQSRMILKRVRNAGSGYVMVNLHMNRYQDYCSCYGSEEGKELLKSLNAFLQVNVGGHEAAARSAGADFGLLLRCDSIEQCEKRLKKLMADLTGIRQDRALHYCAGIYMIEAAARKEQEKLLKGKTDIDQFYHCANVARQSLRETDGEYIRAFDDQILQEQLWKRKAEERMEEALINKEFQMYLQPKYNPVSGKIVGAEALVRWISPTDGFISPGRFIPVFEENGFITRLDDYMISAVAKLQSERKIQEKKAIPISVNVSRANFVKEDLAEHICQLVDAYGADHGSVELEVTESAFFGDKNSLQQTLKELKDYGFRTSMDDFGAGYSSLNSLKDLPIDVLKLDMDFFRGEDAEKRGKVVVQGTIRLAKDLKMEIVAEGIEKKEQVDFLAEQGCDMIQGFYFAKPMPVAEFEERMERDG